MNPGIPGQQEREMFTLDGKAYYKDTVGPEADLIFNQIAFIDEKISEVEALKIIHDLAKGSLIRELLELKEGFELVPDSELGEPGQPENLETPEE